MLNIYLNPHLYVKEESTFDHEYINKLTQGQATILAEDILLLSQKSFEFKNLQVLSTQN